MDISQLRYFCTVAEENQITSASQKLHITQSALSASIQRLEQELGTALFDRVGRRIALNARGEEFCRHAKIILQEYDIACRSVQEPQKPAQSVLTIGCTETNFPDSLVTDFKRQRPDILLRQVLLMSGTLAAATESYDFVLSGIRMDRPEILCRHILRERMFLIVNSADPLAGRFFFRLEDLKDAPFITLPEGCYGRRALSELCRKAGFKPRISIECYQHHIADMVRSGLGVALMPESTIRSGVLPKDLKIIPLIDDYSCRDLYLLQDKRRPGSAAAEVFLQYLSALLPPSVS